MRYITIAFNFIFVAFNCAFIAACCYGGKYFYDKAKLIESVGTTGLHDVYGGTMWIAFVLCVGFGFIYLNKITSCLISMVDKKSVA